MEIERGETLPATFVLDIIVSDTSTALQSGQMKKCRKKLIGTTVKTG